MSKELEQLKADLELVTKTAKVLANKLEKMSSVLETLFASLDGSTALKTAIEAPQAKTPQTKTPKTKAPQAAAPQAKVPSTPVDRQPVTVKSASQTMSFEGKKDSKAARLLDAALNEVRGLTNGQEIAKILSGLRDSVMQSAGIGFHPAFHEMGRYSNQIKNIQEITSEEKEALLEKMNDWRDRLTS